MSFASRVFGQVGKISLFATEFSQDLYMYVRYCGVSLFQDWRSKTYYKLAIEAHAIEKGLSLANPRKLFGRQKLPAIMRDVRRLGMASTELPVLMAVGVLQTYLRVHREAGVSDPLLDSVEALLAERSALTVQPGSGGLRFFPDGMPTPDGSRAWLLTSRFSCRMFMQEPVQPSVVEAVTAIAQTAPSQCNRQATKVHFYSDRKVISELLALQGGSSGFAEEVPGLAVISFDIAAWGGAQQRNQGYVDASLFAMNFMLAAHALGLACCPLNLAVRHGTERRIKAIGGLPADQRLVMMIAVGRPLPGALKAAASPRRPVADVLTIVGAARS